MESIFCFDLVILGNSNVGKSSLLSRYVYNNLPEQIQNTSGVEFLKKTIFEPQIVARLKIWDTAGQERFRNIIRTHYTNSEGALLDYDIHDRDSYNDAIKWAEELNDWTKQPRKVLALVGNKADISHNRVVTTKEAEKYAERNGLIFWETSAATNLNINRCFLEVAIAIKDANIFIKQKQSSWYL